MASQPPPIQHNQVPPTLVGSTGFSQPNFTTNGTGQSPAFPGYQSAAPATSSRFPQPPAQSFGMNSTNNHQWARPPFSGQGSAFTPVNNQPQIGPTTTYTGPPRPPLPSQLAGRPPSTPVMSPSSSGPPSNHTSTNPSPTPTSNFDRMEGQFISNGVTSPVGPTPGMQYRPGLPNVNGNSTMVNGVRPPLPYASPAVTTAAAPFPSTNGGYATRNGPPQQPMPPGTVPLTSGFPPASQPAFNTGYPGQTNGPQQTIPTSTGAPWASPYSTPSYPPTQGQPPMMPPLPAAQRQYPPQPNYGNAPAPNLPGNQYYNQDKLSSQMNALSVTQTGFDKLWGHNSLDLLQVRHVLPPDALEPPRIVLKQEHLNGAHCNPDIFRCTLTKIPETNSILQKSRLPLGVLIHPFKDLTQLPVIQCQTIVRCRSCRTYINPFVYFVDQRRWKCNLCFRINDLPEEFQYDPISNSYGDPTRRPEIKNATIEFIAPAEYMLRPPQPPVYLYLLDVSHAAVENGYLKLFCDVLLDELDKIPGDSRTQIGFMTYDSSVHFYNLAENLNRPHQLIVSDIEDIYLPCPNDLLINLNESKRLVIELLEQMPTKFTNTNECSSALGAALQAAFKMVSPTGGRVTVFQCSLPDVGPGALKAREDPNQRAAKDVPNLNAATDFYKKFALDCSGQQVSVDLFLLGSQYMDIASLSCVSKYTGGCMYHFPGFHYIHNLPQVERLEHSLRRYLTRKIGFESVMRIRCTHGLSIHSFHGNFFVRSTDLLSLPNINPDAGFGLQVSIDENLTDVQNVCFQAALLYTSSKGERRIRVHTMCLPLASTVAEVIQSADQQCIIGLLSKMAVDRSLQSNITDARDALVNVCVDVLTAYKAAQGSSPSGLHVPANLKLLPLYIAALLKSVAFRTGQSTRLDDRVFAMNQFKVLPLSQLMLSVYPEMYAVHNLSDQGAISEGDMVVPQPPRLHLSAEMVDNTGAYLLDTGDVLYLYVGRNVSPVFIENALGSRSFQALPEQMFELPEYETNESERLRNFLIHLQSKRPYPAVLQLVKEDSSLRPLFTAHLVDGRTESSLSYYEFLQHLKNQVK